MKQANFGLGVRVKVEDLGFRVGFGKEAGQLQVNFRFRDCASGFKVWGLGFRVECFRAWFCLTRKEQGQLLVARSEVGRR